MTYEQFLKALRFQKTPKGSKISLTFYVYPHGGGSIASRSAHAIWFPNAQRATEILKGILGKGTSELRRVQLQLTLHPQSVQKAVDQELLNGLVDKHQMVLRARHGLWDGMEMTLEDVARRLNISRERVRQIQEAAERRLRNAEPFRQKVSVIAEELRGTVHALLQTKYHSVASLDELEAFLRTSGNGSQAPYLAYRFLRHLHSPKGGLLTEGLVPCGEGVWAISAEVRDNYWRTVKATEQILAAKKQPASPDQLTSLVSKSLGQTIQPNFLKRCAELSEKIGLDSIGRIGLKQWSHFNPKTVHDMAHDVLLEIGQPAHFNTITEKLDEQFPKRAPFSPKYVLNRMVAKPKIFVSLGHGEWALKESGRKRVPYIYRFLIQQLRAAHRPLSVDTLISRGTSRYGYSPASIKMTLGRNRQVFKKSRRGYYYTLTERFKVHRPVKAIWKKRRRPPEHRR